MAVTSLWHIKGNLRDLIDYVENPDKVNPTSKNMQDFFNVFDYVRRDDKTSKEFVTAINCTKRRALEQMIATKKQYFKEDKYLV